MNFKSASFNKENAKKFSFPNDNSKNEENNLMCSPKNLKQYSDNQNLDKNESLEKTQIKERKLFSGENYGENISFYNIY